MTTTTVQTEEINDSRHQSLLDRISKLPFADPYYGIYKEVLEELFLKQREQVCALEATRSAYNEIAQLILQKQPLNTTRTYARVRRVKQRRLQQEGT